MKVERPCPGKQEGGRVYADEFGRVIVGSTSELVVIHAKVFEERNSAREVRELSKEKNQ